MAKTSMSQRKTMGRVMHEYAHGELKSGPRGQQRSGGGKVKSRRQAIAIALEEAGASKYESKARNRRNLARSKAKEATGRACRDAHECQQSADALGVRSVSDCGQADDERANTGPHRVQLPHVSDVSDVRQGHLFVPE